MASGNVAALLRELAKYPALDRAAILAVSGREGLSGAVGDGGTSFGPFQLHRGGALPSSVPLSQANQWAWSPAGIDYALNRIQQVAGGKRGRAAISAIVGQFERPRDPSSEIAGAIADYGHHGIPAPGAPPAAAAAPSGMIAASPQAGLSALLGQILDRNAAIVGGPSPTSFLQMALGDAAPAATPAVDAAPHAATALPAPTGRFELADVPSGLSTRSGIAIDSRFLPTIDQIAKQFGVRVNSGYRSASHNAQVGGAPNSDHLRGDAVDFVGSPDQMKALYQWAQGRFPYVEPWAQAGGNHVHISFARSR